MFETQTLTPEGRRLAPLIDHTLLRPDATEPEIVRLCAEARACGFRTVCIEHRWLSVAGRELAGSPVHPITVVGFPRGDESPEAKRAETAFAVGLGAREIDMVLNRSFVKERLLGEAAREIESVVREAAGLPVKVILEISELTDTEVVLACAVSAIAGAAFVKTSTGFSKGGATAERVRLMRDAVGPRLGVKASGGVRTTADALAMIEAGATRLGTSASVGIVTARAGGGGGY